MKSRFFTMIAAMVLAMSTTAANIETDRTWYVAGEPMKVSVKTDKALIAYAELCDTRGLAAGVMISLNGGEGEGTIELPADLHSGYYQLSVYTRNSNRVESQLVPIVNPLRKSKFDDIEWVQDDAPIAIHQPSPVNYQPSPIAEAEGHIIVARIKNVYEGTTYSGGNICASLSIVGKQIHYFEGKMVDDSTAVFTTFGIHGKQPLVLSARTSTGVSLPIEMVSPFATLVPKTLPHLVFHYNRSEVEARSLDMQRYQMAMAPAAPLAYDDNVYGTKPDLSYNLDEYRQFLTIREVLLEYVICVSKKKINGVQQLVVRKEQEQYHSFLPSLVLIDGMPVIDTERLLNYDARRIHYINIYGGQYVFGNELYNGILSFVSRSGQLTNYPVERNMQYLVYDFPE